jgi:hypothetical protein
VIGNCVLAKALHVTNEAECARRYGREKKTKILEGYVVSVTITKSTKTNRTSKTIEANYHLGGGVYKQKALCLKSVHPCINPLPTPPCYDSNITRKHGYFGS